MNDAYDQNESDEYRPVSMLAVLSLLAGCGSSLALATQVLWGLPLLGVGLAVAAIRDTAAGPAMKAGRGLALIGLALAVGFGVQAVGAAAVDSWVNKSRAVETVRRWQEAISTKDWIAAQNFCLPAALPQASPFSASHDHAGHDHDHSEDEENGSGDTPQLQAFQDLPVVQAISAHGPATVLSSEWDRKQSGGSWRVNLALPEGALSPLSIWLYPETKRVPRLAPGVTGVSQVELWRIIRLEPGPEQ